MENQYSTFVSDILCRYGPVPEKEKKRMISLLDVKYLSANEYFIQQGDSYNEFGLIYSGIFRVYCITEDGDEKILAFRTTGQFLSAFTPFIKGQNVWYSIQALTAACLLYSPLDNIVSLTDYHHCWEIVVKNYLIMLFMEKEERERALLLDDATTRYENFQKTYPDLEKSLYQYSIASYLGISPVTLSRIRRDMGLEKLFVD